MHPFRYALLRRFVMAPEDGGAGGGADPNAAGSGADPAAGAGGAGGGDGGGTIFDAAGAGDPQPGADGKPARPDYVPEQFWDAEKGEVRTEQMARSWSDFRGKISRGEGKLPEAPEGYTLPAVEGVPADLIAADDPLWVATRAAAHEAGVTDSQMQALLKPYLAAAAKAQGVQPDAEAAKAARQAAWNEEMTKLGPNGRQMVRDVGARIDGMANRGALTAEEAASLKSVGNAAGVRALAKMLEATGAPSIPTEAMQADAMTQADAQRMLQEGHATKDQAKVDKAMSALTILQQRGQLKSVA